MSLLFFRLKVNANNPNGKQSMYQRLFSQSANNLVASMNARAQQTGASEVTFNQIVNDPRYRDQISLGVRNNLRNLVDTFDENAFNYTDLAARELIDHEHNVDFSEVANYLNQLSASLGLGSDSVYSSNDVKAFLNQSAYSSDHFVSAMIRGEATSQQKAQESINQYNQTAPDDQKARGANHGYVYGSLFDRQPMFEVNANGQRQPSRAYYTYFVVNNAQTPQSGSYFTTNPIDVLNGLPKMPSLFFIPNQTSSFITSQAYSNQVPVEDPQLLVAYNQAVQSAQQSIAAQQAQSQSMANRQSTQPTRQQTSNRLSTQQTNVANNVSQQVNNGQRFYQPIPMGEYPVGHISRDDLLSAPVAYVSTDSKNDDVRDQNHEKFRQRMLAANWDHSNGKYFWRAANVPNNSPVTVSELMNALEPFFPTGNMQEMMRNAILDTEGKDNSMSEPMMLQAIPDQEDPQATPSRSYAYGELADAGLLGDQDLRSKAGSSKEHPFHVLSRNGNLFSPSDVAKVQIILQTAQDAGLDYSIASDSHGQVYLKVNDNRGMRVTLLDVENPSNIGTTQDRSGNRYQINWNDVKIGDPNSKDRHRPVFSFFTSNGKINSQPEIARNSRNADARHYALSSAFTGDSSLSYRASVNMSKQEFSDLKNAYMRVASQNASLDDNDNIDPQVFNAIRQELGDQWNQRSLDDDVFSRAVSKAVKKDAMRTYESLPDDFQKFMAVAPMVEALGIDTRRLNSFQELAKKYHYTAGDVVAYGNQRLKRSITPTSNDLSLDLEPLYNPVKRSFEFTSGIGLSQVINSQLQDNKRNGKQSTVKVGVDTANSVMMLDTRFHNYTSQADDYAMSNQQADSAMAKRYRDARIGMLQTLNVANPSDNDLYMSRVLDDYTRLVSDVAKNHHVSLSDEATQNNLAAAYAAVTSAVRGSKIHDGVVIEDYNRFVLQKIENGKHLTPAQKEVTKDFANRLYQFVNNELGTSALQVADGYDRSPEHLNALREQVVADDQQAANDRANGRTSQPSTAKDELKQLNWYEEYGYHDGDQRHYYLDSVQAFTQSKQQLAVRDGFRLVNAAKQTSDQFKETFTAHDPVQSKLIQQRMVMFDPDSQIYLSQMNKPLDSHLYDSSNAFNDWVLTQFNDYMEANGRAVDLAHLDNQYQQWLQDLQTRDVSDLGTYDGQKGQLFLSGPSHALVNADGEPLHRLPRTAPAEWNRYFVDGHLVNPNSKLDEQSQMLNEVYDTLSGSGIMVDYVDLKTGKNIGSQQQWINSYARQHAASTSDEDLAKARVEAVHAFDKAVNDGRMTPDISIDQHGLIHWSGHQLHIRRRQDVAVTMDALRDMHSDDPRRQMDGINLMNNLLSPVGGQEATAALLPVEGQLGQFFVPDRQNIVHTNYYTFSNLSDQERQAVQDDEVASYRAVIQYPRMINQRGDLAPEDMKNFNERLVLSSLPQVLHREIRENLRMQTAQMPISDSDKVSDTEPLPFVLAQMANMNTDNAVIRPNEREMQTIMGSNNYTPGDFGHTVELKRTVLGGMTRSVSDFNRDVFVGQMSRWYTFVMNHQNPELPSNYKQLLNQVASVDDQGQVHWDPDFINDAVAHIDVSTDGRKTGKINLRADDLRVRRNFTRPEDSTIVNKAYAGEIAATKLTRPDQFNASDPKDYDSQETLNRALYQAHRRMRLPNAVGEATNTSAVIKDMEEIENAVQEWMEIHPNDEPFSDPNFEYEIKNRVHSRVQALGGSNIGMLANKQSLGYIDMLSTGQGKVQGLVRVLADNAKITPDGHVKPAMIPVKMTAEDKEAVKNGTNDFDVMRVLAPDPDNPGHMKSFEYRLSPYLDGNALTKDKMFKYLSKLPFDRGFIAVEQAVKADHIDKNATLALMNANIMNMEDGSLVSKKFADTHMIYGANGELRSLETGDKLSDTSGDKTTSAIVIDPDMSLEEAKKQGILDVVLFMRRTGVDIVKSPNSQVSRKNMSQVQDMIDSHDDYNPEGPDGTVKFRMPKVVPEGGEFTDKNGHTYHVGDLMPVMHNGYPAHREPTEEEKAASYTNAEGEEVHFFENGNGDFVKPILTNMADHRKSIAELAKEDANWVKFMEEGGPKAFKDGHHFIDIEGHEQKIWPTGPIFEHDREYDANGGVHYVLRPALAYEMDDNHVVDTNATIGRVAAFVTNIHADDKVNNYGTDPDATTEGRKYSDLVANADAERNATHLTQYLSSVDSQAIPDFREYLKLAGYELSADGRVFTGLDQKQITSAYDAANVELTSSPVIFSKKHDYSRVNSDIFYEAKNVTDLASAAAAMDVSPDQFEPLLQESFARYRQALGSDQVEGWPVMLDKNGQVHVNAKTSEDWKRLVFAMKYDQDLQDHVQELQEAISHPGELRDHYSLDDMSANASQQMSDDALIQNAISLANEKVSSGRVFDIVSPLPPMKGSVDDGTRNANIQSSHQVWDNISHNRLDYQDQVARAMSLSSNSKGYMPRFNSVDEAMTLYTRTQYARDSSAHQKSTVNTVMIPQNGALSKAQLNAIAPLLQRIGINVDSLGGGLRGVLRNSGDIKAVPDLNGINYKLRDGTLAMDKLHQMDAGSEFMEMINNSDGGDLELPDGMTVNLIGNVNSHTISILPQSLRRSRRSQSDNRTTVDDYTRDYAQIGVALKRYQVASHALEITMPPYSANFFANQKLFDEYTKQRQAYLKTAKKAIWNRCGVQEAVDRIQDRMVNSIFGKDNASIKTNFIREHIMSNRVKASSTAVQTNGFNLPVDVIEVSPDILKSLGMKYDPKTGFAYSPVPGDPNDRSWDMVHVHRDPVWRAHGSLGFRVRVNPSIVGVRMSPVTVSLMDGDFDGDTIGLIAVADKEGQRDLHGPVNVLNNVYDAPIDANGKRIDGLGGTDLNVSGELVDLAARTRFKMNLGKALKMNADKPIPDSVLRKTQSDVSDWNFGPIAAEDGVHVDPKSVRKLYDMAHRLHPSSSSLDLSSKTDDEIVNSLNVKKVLQTYYKLGLDVATKSAQEIKQTHSDEETLVAPKDGQMGWKDPSKIIANFIDNSNNAIINDNPDRLAGAGINAYISKDGKVNKVKESYAKIVERGAKGNKAALEEMMGKDYLGNQPLYSPDIMSYAEAMHSFENRIKKFCSEAYTEEPMDNNPSVKKGVFNLSNIKDPAEKKGAMEQFQQIQDNFFDDKHANMFEDNKKNIERQLGLLSEIMDATKEKTDLTGQPGGWQKKLVAALSDMGPEGLVIANAIGYVMTQATLQVKHKAALAHLLGDVEVNGMSSIYKGKYEERPLMLGIVGNRISKVGDNVTLVPLGKNTFTAGLNQQLLKASVKTWSANPQFLKDNQIDLVHNDFSFIALKDKDLLAVADKLVNFDPIDSKGNHLLTRDANNHLMINGKKGSEEYHRNRQLLANGFDYATRPMFSKWDPETGKNLDTCVYYDDKGQKVDDPSKAASAINLKLLREVSGGQAANGKMDPMVMAKSMDEMLAKSQVRNQVPKNLVQRLVKAMSGTETIYDKNGQAAGSVSYTKSLESMREKSAGIMMKTKMEGFAPMKDQASRNTQSLLQRGASGDSIFTQEKAKVYRQTINERSKTLDNQSTKMIDLANKWLDGSVQLFEEKGVKVFEKRIKDAQKLLETETDAKNKQALQKCIQTSQELNKQTKSDIDFFTTLRSQLQNVKDGSAVTRRRAQMLQQSVRQIRVQKSKSANNLTSNCQKAMDMLGHLDARLTHYAAQKGALPNAADQNNMIRKAQERLLARHHLPTNMLKWEAAAQSSLSTKQIKHIKSELDDVAKSVSKNFDQKKFTFVDNISDKKQKTAYMNTVFRPKALDNGSTTAVAIQHSRDEFLKNESVHNTLEMNKILMKAVKASHLDIGGLKKLSGKHTEIEEAIVAKNNCQKIAGLYSSPDKANQQAFKRISKMLAGEGLNLPVGDHKQTDRFERQLQDMLDKFDLAQSNLEFDPTVRNQVRKSDATKASDKEMADFKQKANEMLIKYNMADKKKQEAKTTDGSDLRKEAAEEAHNANRSQYRDYLEQEKAQRNAHHISQPKHSQPTTSQTDKTKKTKKSNTWDWD